MFAHRASSRAPVGVMLFGLTFLAAASAVIFVQPLRSPAADPGAPALLEQQLAAGEFAPALQMAAQAPGGERDGLLSRIALAQVGSAGRDASIATVSQMGDDRARADALGRLGGAQGAAGGGLQPDFGSLIDLITSTVAPSTWDEVGGVGSIASYRGGVYVDAQGELRRALAKEESGMLSELRRAAIEPRRTGDARRPSDLRKVSLTRLEKQLQLRRAAGRGPTTDMALLAGLSKIQYVLVYPESGDIVLAGPAGDWRPDTEGRLVSAESGRPVLHLDDLVVILRYMASHPEGVFGCSITPTEASLARAKTFIEESSKKPLPPGDYAREAWLKKLQASLGQQEISVDGIDPRTRVGQVLVEADYRMKLVGMGLEPGTAKVPSYLSMIKLGKGGAAPPMEVLRWWFTLNYKAVKATEEHDAYELSGQGVRVLSENELVDARGGRVHTGDALPLNAEFAHNFTENFAALAQRYPVYADLQNLFDLSLVSALVQAEGLAERVNWRMTYLGGAGGYQPTIGPAPAKVQTVMNHRVINGKQIIAGVSGGVEVNPWQYVRGKGIEVDRYGKLKAEQRGAAPKQLPPDAWWWD